MQNVPLLEMQNIMFLSKENELIKDISLKIQKGSVTAFLGKSGCGKSIILKILAGIINPTQGKVLFEGEEINKMSSAKNKIFRKRSAFMFQDSALWQNQDIYHNLELPLMIHFPKMTSEERKKRINKYISLVGYDKSLSNRPANLSIGEQKKVSFARSLICEPEILFLDECTESLDIKTVENFISILKEFCYNGNTMIYVSHDDDFIKHFPSDKYVFEKGLIKRVELKNEI